jgi:membrane peptidoglycan carboxypeptidase
VQPANRLDRIALVVAAGMDTDAPRRRRGRWVWVALLALAVALLAAAEAATSWVQSRIGARIGQELTWSLEGGASPHIAFPRHGPYDARLGYTHLPQGIRRLEARGFEVSAQVRMSPGLIALERLGISPPHPEKAAAGLSLLDRSRERLFEARYPRFTWDSFDRVPRLIVASVLFIENRELLERTSPYANPAIEWDRLLRALTSSALPAEGRTPGASTLATQLEKYRHSPGGRTASATEKLRQMASASLRAYHAGPDTRDERQRIVLDYVNTVPLSARPGEGEVTGLGDGLLLWHGADPGEVTRLLADPHAPVAARGRAYAQVLSLLLAERRPSHYLLRDREALGELLRSYLPLLERAGIIDAELRDAALAWRVPERVPDAARPAATGASKATAALRAHLVELLGLQDVYALDRLDLSVDTTLDARAQREVEALLAELRDPQRVSELGLRGERLLGRGGLDDVVYSVLVFERTARGNALRVQADTLPQPFNVNEGMKLDLGSTAKLRTLVHYLQLVAGLHARYAGREPRELAAQRIHPKDAIGRWVAERMIQEPRIGLEELLSDSLERTYSASPHERFFTGGGLHRFANFDELDDVRRVTLREAFTRSVNLPFVRLMREIVQHVLYGPDGRAVALLDDPAGWSRKAYLRRFAESDARGRLDRFRARHAGLTHAERVDDVLARIRPVPQRLAAFHAWNSPRSDAEGLGRLLDARLPGHGLSPVRVASLWRRHAPDALAHLDRARIMRIDPLELWLIDFLRARPGASEREQWAASVDVREADWAWIFRTRNERARERRIAALLERDAFAEIHRAWQRLGYPFGSLVPSLATAIGASADRPAALAELVGIVIGDGLRAPLVRVEQLHFGVDTPYETHLQRRPATGERVVEPEVARTVRRALLEVVSNGTARRAKDLLGKAPGAPAVGGKTGTGDSRIKRFAPGGRLIGSRVTSRSATFAFAVGDRYFGVITAYVAGPEASRYEFTSSLPVQILRLLEPPLEHLVRSAPGPLEPELAGSDPGGSECWRSRGSEEIWTVAGGVRPGQNGTLRSGAWCGEGVTARR